MQPIVFNSQAELSMVRDDRLAFGMGTKFRKFLGIHFALEKRNILNVILQGESHSNALAAFAFLFQNFGYHVHTFCYSRDRNRSSANSIFVKRNSYSIQEYDSRSKWKNAIERISIDAKPETTSSQRFLKVKTTHSDVEGVLIPEYGLSRAALDGLDSLWKQIPVEKYDRLVLDIGSGASWLGANRFFQNRIEVVGVSVGLPKKKMVDWLRKKSDSLNLKTMIIDENQILESTIGGGFGSRNMQILEYCKSFYEKYKIPIEPIYSGKSLYTIQNKMDRGELTGRTLYIHQGGLWNFLDVLIARQEEL
ncbi:1-aminocyclopropane-1-carboxylate deaminase [Leptospira alstonii]|uniref:1-aminocyclopropane-1-carboxylate deaminase n=1 Tax=Leptospira alstonii TaxID=28452 RepID=UPI001E2D2553|nr:1-aminocyclopropane-1-carboxylate deaminase [Leptospira alstonii]